jgi:hypothetical protein
MAVHGDPTALNDPTVLPCGISLRIHAMRGK